jgi:hypothetical protein
VIDPIIPWQSKEYLVLLGILILARGMDFLSTWIATPNLVLEANPIARKLGWKGGLVANALVCAGFATWPLATIIIATTSVLVAARNFQSAWLMRFMGEHEYQYFMAEQIRRVPVRLYLLCLLGQTGLIALVGLGLLAYCHFYPVPFGIGIGMLAYALAVSIYTSLSFWRIRRGPRE